MAMTDTTADLLTRIRNAQSARKNWVDIPSSNFKIRILFILKEEHFIRDYVKVDDGKHGFLRVFLCYDDNNFPVIHGIKKISKSGCRKYVSSDNIPRVQNGTGVAILSTSKGVMSSKKAKLNNVGGEVVCYVW